MSYEQRGSHRYYYRARKVDGRVVKEYVGHGPLSEAMVAQDELARVERRAAAEARGRRQSQLNDLDRAVDAAGASIETLFRASLTAAGYHRHHRGEWRRRQPDG